MAITRSLTIKFLSISLMSITLSMNELSASEFASTTPRNTVVIDDRSSGDLYSTLGSQWRLVTDSVMGGLSQGQLTLHNHQERDCLRMQGNVSTENNGGFVQIALPLSADVFDASAFDGIEIEVSGNAELYNIHLRTDGLWFPWQSYRYSFTANPEWQTYRIPFARLEKYKTFTSFDKKQLTRIGLVAIGRDFQADLCLAAIRFYVD